MSRPFVIATCDAAAEVLKEAGTFDHIVTVTDQLHEGPCPPDDDIEAFFANRRRVMAATLESHERDTRPGAYGRGWLGKLADCRYANRIEIWADPTRQRNCGCCWSARAGLVAGGARRHPHRPCHSGHRRTAG